MQLPASSLREGHTVDLEPIADWCWTHDDCNYCESARDFAQYEYATVEGGELETNECYRLDTDQGSFGLPPDLLVDVIEVVV